MAMATAYLTVCANAGAGVVTHVGLVNDVGVEISGGTYARLPVTWVESGGQINLSTNLTFDIPAGVTVGGWRGYSALTAGTNYGGADLTPEVYSVAGQYTLVAASTAIDHNAA